MRHYLKTSFRRERKSFLIRRKMKNKKRKKKALKIFGIKDSVDFLKDI